MNSKKESEIRWVCMQPTCVLSRGVHQYEPSDGICRGCGMTGTLKRMTVADVEKLKAAIRE